MMLKDDPRANPFLVAQGKTELVFRKYGAYGKPIPSPSGKSPLSLLYCWFDVLEKRLMPAMLAKMAERAGNIDFSCIEKTEQIIDGMDGNKIKLFISKPKGALGSLPALVYTHGGGMAMCSAKDSLYQIITGDLARRGFVVIAPEFRNSAGLLGRHPYPAGLNDCMSALAWAHKNRGSLGNSKILLAGDSGGGNLCLSMAIRAKREGRLDQIDGVFAFCPYIAGPTVWKSKSLDSLRENQNYFIADASLTSCAKLYDPTGRYAVDPCAWPYLAAKADLEGLPPHIISVNELDPLRDEGLEYAEKLKGASVQVSTRVVKGTAHGGDLLTHSVKGAEHISKETFDAVKTFAASL